MEKTRPASPQHGEFDEHILCAACDGSLGRFDDYALSVSRRFPSEHVAVGERDFELSNFDGSAYLKFALSVLWRASISQRPQFQSIALGKYQDVARDVIFGARSLSNFGAFRVIVTRPRSQYEIDPAGFFTYPMRSALAGKWVSYQFALGGFRIITILDTRPLPPEFAPYIVNDGGTLRGFFQNFENTPEFRAMTDMTVAESVRRGVPPWELGSKRPRRR
jgi:hypothetical protein